jgi:uncharacterized protein (TIGR03435 family)
MSKVLASLIMCTAMTMAQTPTAPQQFDVVSIKPNTAIDNRFAYYSLPGGTLSATGVTLKFLMMEAYDVKAFQISGGPGWLDTARWDIEGKVDGVQGRLSSAQHGTMVRALLGDRFHLKIRRETREMAVFVLTVGKEGSKLIPHTGDPPTPGQRNRLGFGTMSVKQFGMPLLVSHLERELWSKVIDRTGLTGEYDFTLTWRPEPTGHYPGEALGLPPQLDAPPPPETNGPSIFAALQEQLGLKLESRKAPVEIIVIDGVEKASAN